MIISKKRKTAFVPKLSEITPNKTEPINNNIKVIKLEYAIILPCLRPSIFDCIYELNGTI